MPFKKELKDINSEPNVVPMADIMLVLLIIFMVITPMLQKGVSVDLVRTQNPRNMPDADKSRGRPGQQGPGTHRHAGGQDRVHQERFPRQVRAGGRRGG
ncbi:MAG: outer rane transport energization protein ExbD [Acidobacteria bacterium]|nr:outer rane transport energization protein ExbD [Acidobacteriota bacterium]